MKNHLRFIALVALLYTVQGPFCALACLEDVRPTAAASVSSDTAGSDTAGEPAAHDMASCHGGVMDGLESDPSSRPPIPTPQRSDHGDCGCEGASEAVPAAANLAWSLAPPPLAAPLASAPTLTLDARSAATSAGPHFAGLPPPDILLLKSTLLI